MLNRRKSTIEAKYVFEIHLQTITLKKPGAQLEKDATISVLLERGSKHIQSTEKDYKLSTSGDAIIQSNETLSLDATLYQDGSSIQEKVGKLIIRKKKRGMMTSHTPIGSFSLPLHVFAEETHQPIEKSFLVEQCPFPGSQVTASIKFRRVDGKSTTTSNTAPVATTNPSSSAAPPPVPTSDPFDDPFASDIDFPSTLAPAIPVPPRKMTTGSNNDGFNGATDFGSSAGTDFDPFAESFPAATATGGHGAADWPATPATKASNNPAHRSSPSNNDLNSSNNSLKDNDLEFAKSVIVMQEEKLQQAAQFVAFQEQQIQALNAEVELLRAHSSTVSGENGHHDTLSKQESDMEKVIVIQEQKLEQAKVYIQHQAEELSQLQEQMQQASQKIYELEEKIVQAKEYIDFQAEQIETLQATGGNNDNRDEDGGGAAKTEEMQAKMQQAAEYIRFQDEQLQEAQNRIAELEEQLAASSLANSAEGVANGHGSIDSSTADKIRAQQAEAKLAALQAKYDNQHEHYFTLKEEVEQLRQLIKTHNETAASSSSLEEKMLQAAEFIKYQDEQLAEKDSSLVAEHKRVEQLQAVLVEAQKALTQADDELYHTKATLAQKTKDLEQTQEQLAHHMQLAAGAGDVSAQLMQLQDMDEKVQKAKEFIQFQDEQLAEKDNEIESLSQMVEHERANVAKLQALMSDIKQSMETLDRESDEKDSALANKEKECKQLSQQIGQFLPMQDEFIQLEQKVKAYEKQVRSLQDKNDDLEQQLMAADAHGSDENQSQLVELQEKIQQAKEFMSYQDEQLAEKEETINGLQTQLQQEQQQAQELSASMQTGVHEYQILATKFEQTTLALKEKEKQITGLQADHQKLQATLEKVNKHAVDVEKRLLATEKELHAAQAQVANQSANSSSVGQELKAMEAKMTQAQEYITYIESQLEESKADIERSSYMYTAQLAEASEELAELQQKSSEMAAELEEARHEIAQLQADRKATSSAEHEELRRRINGTEEEIRSANSRIQQTAEELEIYNSMTHSMAEKLLRMLPEQTQRQLADKVALRNVPAKQSAPMLLSLLDSVAGYYSSSDRTVSTNQSSGSAASSTAAMKTLEAKLQQRENELEAACNEKIALEDEVNRLKSSLAASSTSKPIAAHDNNSSSNSETARVYEQALYSITDRLLTLLPERSRQQLLANGSLAQAPPRDKARMIEILMDSVKAYYSESALGPSSPPPNTSSAATEELRSKLKAKEQEVANLNADFEALVSEMILVKMELANAKGSSLEKQLAVTKLQRLLSGSGSRL